MGFVDAIHKFDVDTEVGRILDTFVRIISFVPP
jgi:hypothetical protein